MRPIGCTLGRLVSKKAWEFSLKCTHTSCSVMLLLHIYTSYLHILETTVQCHFQKFYSFWTGQCFVGNKFSNIRCQEKFFLSDMKVQHFCLGFYTQLFRLKYWRRFRHKTYLLHMKPNSIRPIKRLSVASRRTQPCIIITCESFHENGNKCIFY